MMADNVGRVAEMRKKRSILIKFDMLLALIRTT